MIVEAIMLMVVAWAVDRFVLRDYLVDDGDAE